MTLADKTMTCKDCGAQFIWTMGEQTFYQERGLLHEPARCPECRATRKRDRVQTDGGAPSAAATRQMFTVTCDSCGIQTQVPFEPRQGRPVYCSTCFATVRGASPAARA